jgi:hypothetical protein
LVGNGEISQFVGESGRAVSAWSEEKYGISVATATYSSPLMFLTAMAVKASFER